MLSLEIERQWTSLGVADLGPALDAREEPLDARPVAADAVAVEFVFVNDQAAGWIAHPESVGVALVAWMAGDPGSVRVLPIHRHQVFGAGEDEDVRILGVEVLRQALVGLARDRRKGKAPAEAERAVAGAGVVGQRELRAEARAAGAGGDGHRHRAGAGDRVGGELLADAADGAAALGQRDRRCGDWELALAGQHSIFPDANRTLPSVCRSMTSTQLDSRGWQRIKASTC